MACLLAGVRAGWKCDEWLLKRASGAETAGACSVGRVQESLGPGVMLAAAGERACLICLMIYDSSCAPLFTTARRRLYLCCVCM